MTGPNWRGFAVALAIGAAVPVWAGLLAGPARAQFWERFDRQQQQTQQRDYFPFRFFGDRDRGAFGQYGQPARPSQPVDSSKAPSPSRKAETPPTNTVLVIGDSFADWLGYGLEEAFADTPEIGIVRKIRPSSGLIRYDGRNENLDWWQAAKDMLASEKPSAIVVMLGLNDRISIRDRAPRGAATPAGQAAQPAAPNSAPASSAEQNAADAEAAQPPAATETQRAGPGASYEFHTDKWGELYEKRIDDMIAVLKAKGVPVVWVGLPAIRGPRSTSDMSYLDELFRARAEKAGITYVDVWDGFVDESGRYAVQGPDFEGQTRRLRSGDGIHFTKPGAVKLAHYVEHELRRLMSNHVVPVALPSPEEQAPQNGAPAGVKPAIGPVVPLTAALGAEGGDLLGAGGRADPPKADPIVLRVLSHGDAIAAPAGRADDFSWPRSEFGTRTSGTASASAEPATVAPAAARDQKKPPEPQPQSAVTEPDPAPVQQPPSLAAPPKADDVKKPEPRRQSTGQGRGQGTGQGAAQGAAQTNPGAAPAAPPKQHRTRTTQENVPRPPLSIGGWRTNTW